MLDILTRRGQNGPDSGEKVGLGSIRRPVIGLALGGGAARGFAHIGIVRTLIAHGIVPNVVVGTSIGAVVGGAYASGHLDRLGTALQGQFVGLVRVLDPERHAAGRGTMFRREVRRDASGLAVYDEIDIALAIQRHVFRPVIGDLGESQHLEYRLDDIGRRRREFDELEAHESHRIVK